MPESALGVDLGGTKAPFVSGPHTLRFDTGPTFRIDEVAGGAAMAAVVNLLNPSRLALGGGAADLPVRVAAGERVVALGPLRAPLAQPPQRGAST